MAISDTAFAYLRDLVYRRSAIVLEPGKDYLIESRLAPLAVDVGLDSVDALVGKLQREQWTGLHARVIESMTTNETSFFRDMHPFEALRTAVVPARIAECSEKRPLTIWSAACSTGQEPYSIAMVIREHFPELARKRAVRIVATDLSCAMIERARRGVYKQAEVERGVPAAMLGKFFDRAGDDWQLRSEVLSMVELRQMNLAAPWGPLPTFDVVFLRNVLIYFDVETKKRILSRVRNHLEPNGYLFLGGAETTFNLEDAFAREQQGKAVYYRLVKETRK